MSLLMASTYYVLRYPFLPKFGVDYLKTNIIITGTITYALRGRDILRSKGFRASVERNLNLNSRYGCGYGIAVYGDIETAVEILKENNVKVLDIAPKS